MSVWVWDCEFEYLSKSISICACINLFTIYYWTWSKALQSLEETSAIYICISIHQYTYSMNPGVKLALVEVSRANRAKWKDGQTLSTRYWEAALLKTRHGHGGVRIWVCVIVWGWNYIKVILSVWVWEWVLWFDYGLCVNWVWIHEFVSEYMRLWVSKDCT